MFNLRYHIASLVAVFLSLALGLLLGTIIVERGVLDSQQAALVEGLRSEFTRLADEIDELRAQVEAHTAFLDEAVPALVEGSLEETSVLVLSNAGRSDGLSALGADIRMGGGRPVVVLASAPSLGLEDPDTAGTVAGLLGRDLQDTGSLLESVAASLTAEWTSPSAERPITDALIDSGVLSSDEIATAEGFGALVVVSAWNSTPDPAGIALARAFTDAGLPAVGVESPTSKTGVAAAFAAEGLSAIDHLTTYEGTYTLIRVLSGTATGAFGYSPSAQSAFPDVGIGEAQ